jgi:hypothetical protein
MATAKKEALKDRASSGHITNLKQSILETFDIHDQQSAAAYYIFAVEFY